MATSPLYITALKEYCDKHSTIYHEYQLLEQKGPPHQPIFVMGVVVNRELLGKAEAAKKQEAKAKAAQQALACLYERDKLRLQEQRREKELMHAQAMESAKKWERIFSQQAKKLGEKASISGIKGEFRYVGTAYIGKRVVGSSWASSALSARKMAAINGCKVLIYEAKGTEYYYLATFECDSCDLDSTYHCLPDDAYSEDSRDHECSNCESLMAPMSWVLVSNSGEPVDLTSLEEEAEEEDDSAVTEEEEQKNNDTSKTPLQQQHNEFPSLSKITHPKTSPATISRTWNQKENSNVNPFPSFQELSIATPPSPLLSTTLPSSSTTSSTNPINSSTPVKNRKKAKKKNKKFEVVQRFG